MKRGWYYLAKDGNTIGPFSSKDEARWASTPVALAIDEMPKDWRGVIGLQCRGFAGLAMDKASVRSYDKDGRLHVADSNISKAVINDYWGHEIPDWEKLKLQPNKKYRLLRHPEELKKAAHTFNNLPILSRHVPVSAQEHRSDLTIGSTGSHARFEHPYLKNSLAIWPKTAIDAIEGEDQKELSCAYSYKADMSPGKYEGEAYDGVMRDLVGNHVALVKEGRAGSDVVVGDEQLKESHDMPQTVLSRKGVALLGALLGFTKPKLALDAKPNFYPVLKDVTAKNFAERKTKIASDVKAICKPLLAKDANLEDITALLDALEKEEVAEGADTDPNSGMPMSVEEMETRREKSAEDEEKMWNERAEDAKKGLGRDESPEELEAREKKQAAEDAKKHHGRDETPEEMRAREEKQAGDRKARDAKRRAKDETPVKQPEMYDKPAMDAKLKEVREQAVRDATQAGIKLANDIRDAENAVRPYVGGLPGLAFDSAEGVYRAALVNLGQDSKEVADLPLGALKAILKAQPTKGKSPTRIAQDSVPAGAADAYAERFPNAMKIAVG